MFLCPAHIVFLSRKTMREPSIFVDEPESDDLSDRHYLLTVVMRDQSDSIAESIKAYEDALRAGSRGPRRARSRPGLRGALIAAARPARAGSWIRYTLLDSSERNRETVRKRPGNGGSQPSQEVHGGVQAADRAALPRRQAQGRADGEIRPGKLHALSLDQMPRRGRRVCLLAGPHDREIVGHAASGRKDARIAAASSRTPASTACWRRSISGGPSPARATHATTRSSSPPTGSRRRSSPIGGRSPTSASSAASPTHAFGGATRRGCIRRWAT